MILEELKNCQALWLKPVILATEKVEIKNISV
jgi:hypothetical protein